MAMPSISQLSALERLRAATALGNNSVGAVASTPTVARQPDAVSISDSARSMVAARKAVGDAPEVRADKVSAIKASIADGTYSIDSRRLAAKILSHV